MSGQRDRSKTWRPINADLIGVPGGALRVTTPALMLDLPALRANLATMTKLCADAGFNMRPHAKTHKSSDLAKLQIEYGALGVCCATPHEAIALAHGGVPSIHITTPVVQPRHFEELARLHNDGLSLMVAIDHPAQLAQWQKVLDGSARKLPMLVDIDIGMKRTGVATVADAVAIAKGIAALAQASYAGAQAYSGMVQHINDYAERRKVYGAQLDRLAETLEALVAAGLKPAIVSGGGTGTFAIDVERTLYTEVQVGSYVFMDVEYNAVQFFADRPNPYETSLYLRTSVVNTNADGQVSINAGFKSFATDGPLALLMGEAQRGNTFALYGDEFGRVVLGAGAAKPALGSPIDLITPHCDPTVNLHDCFHVVENDTIVDIWPVVARGTL
ncbi:MAG TPA: alanine racemase [Pseudolabrys sp.]|nr:alanine racemase [Pseudolabrys sp.]